MSDPTDVQEFIDQENARRGRGPESEGDEEDGDGGDEGEEKSHNDRLRESILDGGDGSD
jgi:hypothetical protein